MKLTKELVPLRKEEYQIFGYPDLTFLKVKIRLKLIKNNLGGLIKILLRKK